MIRTLEADIEQVIATSRRYNKYRSEPHGDQKFIVKSMYREHY